jgi:EspG family
VGTPTLAARRLSLSSAELAVLCRYAGLSAPSGFEADFPAGAEGADAIGEADLAAASDALAARDILPRDARGRLHPSVAVSLAVLAAPAALVHVEAAVREGGLRAAYAVRGPLGCSLFASPGGVELSMFPAVELGRELVRAVPEVPPPAGGDHRIRSALAGAPNATVVAGRLPLAALAESGAARGLAAPADLAAALGLSGAEAALAADVASRAVGVLRAVVAGPAGAAGARGASDAAAAGEVLWLATGDGWIGLRPDPDGSGRRMVDIVPVGSEDIGSWLAPYLAPILEAADG